MSAAAAALLLAGCAVPEETIAIIDGYDPEETVIEDPFESQNRSIYALNDYADRQLFKPVARAYRRAAPAPARSCIAGIFDNLKEPIRTVAHLISLDEEGAASSSSRFLFNTIGGGLGCVDVAGKAMGIEEEESDLGLAVRSWTENDESLYLMLPLFGPTTLIDGSMDYAATTHLDAVQIARSRRGAPKEDRSWLRRNPYDVPDKSKRQAVYALRAVDAREGLLDATDVFDEIAYDRYLLLRDVYLDQRERDARAITERRKEKLDWLF
ncbi:MAG: VacJ family lipoprotein [Betaproteobacteria bacterium AqS2]|uniref:VacJ family lipoprotein n=1 Tax=Candidatus Amphirhobacter heronislandensis TaxID=1732024 RepID=A0A930UE53_9GAMM|nr:VacJ family lipoprotein [Betaproteobacteria bacterium AqS2]